MAVALEAAAAASVIMVGVASRATCTRWSNVQTDFQQQTASPATRTYTPIAASRAT